MSRADGIARTVDGIRRSLDYAERRGVVLCMENHYKDGTWRYPEFAQPEDIFLEIVERIDSPHFGVQYDPSNALVGGYDPMRFLEKVQAARRHDARLGSLPRAGRDARRAATGGRRARLRRGKLRHGETGKGLNDYDAIFRILAERRLRRLDLGRGRHERPRRDRALGGVPQEQARRVLRCVKLPSRRLVSSTDSLGPGRGSVAVLRPHPCNPRRGRHGVASRGAGARRSAGGRSCGLVMRSGVIRYQRTLVGVALVSLALAGCGRRRTRPHRPPPARLPRGRPRPNGWSARSAKLMPRRWRR